MIQIVLENAGKRYNRDWIFRNLNQTFTSGDAVLISGSNGSGKTTLLKAICGYAPLSSGRIHCTVDSTAIPLQRLYKHFSICAPYLELYDELTLAEAAAFHFKLKPALPQISARDFADIIELEHAKDKAIKYFSSGMKQRVRLGLALLSDTKAVLLDEPVSNLDKKAILWYRSLIATYRMDRLVVVSSNQQPDEYYFCDKEIRIEEYKP